MRTNLCTVAVLRTTNRCIDGRAASSAVGEGEARLAALHGHGAHSALGPGPAPYFQGQALAGRMGVKQQKRAATAKAHAEYIRQRDEARGYTDEEVAEPLSFREGLSLLGRHLFAEYADYAFVLALILMICWLAGTTSPSVMMAKLVYGDKIPATLDTRGGDWVAAISSAASVGALFVLWLRKRL